jgi:hypothetical protein
MKPVWRGGMALVLALVLAACVMPQPFRSPQPFSSPPRAALSTTFLPLALGAPQLAPLAERKKGISLACGYEDLARMARETAALEVAWLWNWGTDPPVFARIESVPTLWDASVIGQPLGGNSRWLLGFNEPDQYDQANLTPAAAALAWGAVERDYPDRLLTSPQVVRPEDHWLERWYTAYQAQNGGRAPRVDALAIHTYWGQNRAAYEEQVTYYVALAQAWGVPEVWVTEFTLAPELDRTLQATLDDLQAYLDFLDAQPTVTRYAIWTNRVECSNYAPNTFFDTPLYAANGQLTAMGHMYAEH